MGCPFGSKYINASTAPQGKGLYWLSAHAQLGKGGASLGRMQTHRHGDMKFPDVFQQGNFFVRTILHGHRLPLHPTQLLDCCWCLLSYLGGWQDPKAQQRPLHVGTDGAGTSVDRQMGRQMEEGSPVPGGQRSLGKRGMLRLL